MIENRTAVIYSRFILRCCSYLSRLLSAINWFDLSSCRESPCWKVGRLTIVVGQACLVYVLKEYCSRQSLGLPTPRKYSNLTQHPNKFPRKLS